jgi:hypothetical protein
MNAAFTHHYFLRMVHLAAVSPFGQFLHEVSLPLPGMHRCPMI